MLIPSIFFFFTLVYREIGKQIVHPVPVRWKENVNKQYQTLCEKVKQSRLERNDALDTVFKITSLAGFTIIILFAIIVGRNKFLFELAIGLILFLNLSFCIPQKKQFKVEIIRATLLTSAIGTLGIILLSFNIIEQKELIQTKYYIGIVCGDSNYQRSSTFIFYYSLMILTCALFGFLFRIVMGGINEIIYLIVGLIIRFSKFLGEENALGVLLFMITSCSYLINAVWQYNVN